MCVTGLDDPFSQETQTMADEKTNPQTPPATQAQDLMAKLKAPMTITAPTWVFAGGGLFALLMLFIALD
ncbi:hypothetical protein Dshi_2870 [Dinoroseobacter shibae DFL 12 = DSM 16493]|jgi:type VI protein secretion system component VasF|uniref:Uncharacterized protein n=2 Tax=Dinoroseobacter shibae TaxID=215813 RepID=A8LJK0_DINSH|nr:hypothetical protein Dshi_2870 [Dinoroseobacter shibae DFL 12 = DSM 16493]